MRKWEYPKNKLVINNNEDNDVVVEFIGARVVKPVDDADNSREHKNIKRAYQVLVSGKGIGPDDSNPPPSTRTGGKVWLFTLLMLEQIQPIVAQGKRHEKSCKLPMFLSDYPVCHAVLREALL